MDRIIVGGTFWSLGLGYNLHHEKFMERLTFINLLKIRGSIGTTGDKILTRINPWQCILITMTELVRSHIVVILELY